MENLAAKREAHKLTIRGRVQGVGFRAAIKASADLFKLTGYVKNLTNRDVECLVEGDQKNIKQFIDWVDHGHSYAVVEEVLVTRQAHSTPQFVDFSIVYE